MPAIDFRWLHLSDLHVGMYGQDWLWPNISSIFLDNLQRQIVRRGGCDLVIFSGDLVQRGAREEFDKFDEIIGQIWQTIRGTGFDPPLFTVPGNHDLARPPKAKSTLVALKRWFETEEIREDFFSDLNNEYRMYLFEDVFKEYVEWSNRPCVQSIKRISTCQGILPGDCSAELTVTGGSVGLIGLNSTWLQLDGEPYERRLHVDFRQILPLMDGNPSAWAAAHDVNLLVSHQPTGWLAPASEQAWMTEIYPTGRFDAHLFGHMHEATASSIAISGSSARVTIQAPSLFGLERLGDKVTSRIHGYLLCKLTVTDDERLLRIWPYATNIARSRDRQIIPDHTFALDDDGSVLIPLGQQSPKIVAKRDAALSELREKSTIQRQDELGNVGYALHATEAHRAVRKPEQQLCAELLRKKKAVWLGASWGLASDEFLACVQRQLFSTAIETFRLDLSNYDGSQPLIDFLDKNNVKSFSSICERLAKKGPTFVIFDGLRQTHEQPFVNKVDDFSAIVRDYCPQAHLVFRARTLPRASKLPTVELRALDEPDCRAYIVAHEFGGLEYANMSAVARIFRYTDGLPPKIDNALRDIQIVGVAGLIPLNTDLIEGGDEAQPSLASIDQAIAEIAESGDITYKRAFAFLKYLTLLP